MAQFTNWWHSWGEIAFLATDVVVIAITMIVSRFASRKIWWWLVPMFVLTGLVIPDLLVKGTPDPVWVVISFVGSTAAILLFVFYLIFGRERAPSGYGEISSNFGATQKVSYPEDMMRTQAERGDAATVAETEEHEEEKTRIIRKTTPAFAWLVGIGGRIEGRRFDVSDELTTIGRSPANKIVLDSDSVSKDHAKIKYFKDEDVFKVYDLVSTNGTFVEGVRVEAPIALQDGSKVEFGEEPLVFKRVTIRKAKRDAEQT
jgi:hypothetical protein